jgi:hypothetical protein
MTLFHQSKQQQNDKFVGQLNDQSGTIGYTFQIKLEYGAHINQIYKCFRALTMQTLLWSLKLFITSNNVDLESK